MTNSPRSPSGLLWTEGNWSWITSIGPPETFNDASWTCPCWAPICLVEFDEQLAVEIKRKKDINKADITFTKDSRSSKSRKSPSRPSSHRQPKCSGFLSRRNQPSTHQQRGRSRNQPSFRGFSGTSSAPYATRRPSRGSSRSGSRGSGRFQPTP